jgi:hypothetical protein
MVSQVSAELRLNLSYSSEQFSVSNATNIALQEVSTFSINFLNLEF